MISAESPVSGMTRVTPPEVGPDPKLAAALGALMKGEPLPVEAKDPYEDDQLLLKTFKEFHRQSFDQRWNFERNWWRNLLYTLGRQWIFYNQQRGAWQDKRMHKWIPRPVTNKIAETVDSMRSVFQSVELGVKVRPVSDDSQDTQTAETSEKLAPCLHSEHGMDGKITEADFWAIETGNAFLTCYFDPRPEHGMLLVPFERCLACTAVTAPDEIVKAGNTCPKCGAMQFETATNEDGSPIGREYPVGRGATDVCSPFEIGFPGGYNSFDDLPGLIRQRWRTKDYYEKNYPDIARSMRFERSSGERSMQLLKALASQSDVNGTAQGAQTADTSEGEGCTEYELWLKPSPQFPRGLLARFVGGQGQELVLRKEGERIPGPLPNTNVKGQPIFPWIHYGYHRVGGRIWARSPLDLIIQKQDQINQLDSLILLGVQRMSNPVWLEPKGAEVKKFTGEPGLVVKYNPLIAGGNAKPERIEGSSIPPSLLKLREQYISDLEGLAGTQDVLKGAKPAGVSAFSAMQLLVERAQSRFGPVLAERGACYRKWFQLALEIEREFGPEERAWAAMGPNRRWTFEKFKNADLLGSVVVLIEDGSQAPKTNLGTRAAVEQLRQLGMLRIDDPDQVMKVYQVFGQTNLLPGLDAQVQGVLAEQARFEQWAQSPGSQPAPMPMAPIAPIGPDGQQPQRGYFDDPAAGAGAPPEGAAPIDPLQMQPAATLVPVPLAIKEWHDDLVHISEHTKWANSDNARSLFEARPDVESAFELHLLQHKFRAAQAAQAAAAAQAGPQEPGGGGRAMQNSNQESGKRGANQAAPA